MATEQLPDVLALVTTLVSPFLGSVLSADFAFIVSVHCACALDTAGGHGSSKGHRVPAVMNRVWRTLQEGYWVIPALCVVGAGALALVLVWADEGLHQNGFVLVFAGGPDSARSLLSTISTSMLSLAALTFSITMVVLQLASSQFSPRAMPTFLRDRQNQLSLGVFLATYVYALLALREIRGTEAPVDQFVPGLTIGVAFALVLVSIGFFVAYIHHIATSIQVATILQHIDDDCRRAIRREYGGDTQGEVPPARPSTTSPSHIVEASRAGVLAGVDVARLVDMAHDRDVLVRLLARPGDFIPSGAPLLVVEGGSPDDRNWGEAVVQVSRRDEHIDVTLGLRQLVDIAERALSPGINDPSTASQCLDHVHDLLRALATATYPSDVNVDEQGQPRLVTPQVQWADHVGLVLDEIRLWGSGSLQVRGKLQRMVDDLLTVVPPGRRQPLLERLPLFSEPLLVGASGDSRSH